MSSTRARSVLLLMSSRFIRILEGKGIAVR
jgi:hypothetical protein